MRRKCFVYYCDDIEDVENYEAAKKVNFKGWHCHHRLETHTSDGKRRLVHISKKELIALDMYLRRPAEELIFLSTKEHTSLHHRGKHLSEETKRLLSETLKGHSLSDDARKEISIANKGKHWKLVDGKRVWY